MNTVVDQCIPDEAVCDLLLMRPYFNWNMLSIYAALFQFF